MAKELRPQELEKLINSAISELSAIIDNFSKSDDAHKRKSSALISYWVKDYSKYLKEEENFLPPNYKYNRGDIILVNFGYRIGSELGGKHFALVLDKHNNKKSPIITVLPLSSIKDTYRESIYSFPLEFGVYELYQEKRQRLLDETMQSVLKAQDLNKKLFAEVNPDEEKLIDLQRKIAKINKKIQTLNDIDNALLKVKKGTSVSVSQITTISKQRILNPKKNNDTLSGIHLHRNDLDKVNSYLTNLYLFHKD